MRMPDSSREIVRCNSIRTRNSNKKKIANIQKLNIDGFFFDSSAVAAILQGTDGSNDSHQQFQSREIIFRNVAIDSTVLQGAKDLTRQRNDSECCSKDKENDYFSSVPITSIDVIHCSGLVSELIRIVLPMTRRFSFAGNIPIAHNLDTVGLSIIGGNLGNTSKHTITPISNGDHRGIQHSCGQLNSLILKGTKFESSGFKNFCDGLGDNTNLEDLQLSNCFVEENDVLLLASALRKNRTLKSVSFANCSFGTKTQSLSNSRESSIVETTQSINNTNPQMKLPIVLEALIHHPTLQSLKIYGMYCNERSIQAIGTILSWPESELRHLGLKNNLSHPQSKLPCVSNHLFRSLSENRRLTYLKLSGNNLNDEDMIQLGRILTDFKTSIQNLSITNNLISEGLIPLASRLSDAKSLRFLDILRNPLTVQSKMAMVSALKNNVLLERLDLDGSWDEEKYWWLSLNRGGRRILQYSGTKSVPSSLWPTILERAYNMPFRRSTNHTSLITNEGVVYYLIRRIPWLFEKASISTGKITERKPEQKRQRKRVVKVDYMDIEPKTKRKFNE